MKRTRRRALGRRARPEKFVTSPKGAERLWAMIEASVDCVITIDAQSTILEFNAAAEQTFGYQRKEVIGKRLTEAIIPAYLRERHLREMTELLNGRASKLFGKRVEMPAMRSDGSEFPVELTVMEIAGQTPRIFTAYLRDITDRIRADEALAAQAVRYKTLMEMSTDSIYILDEKGDLQEANAAFLHRRGYTAAEAKGLNVTDWDAQRGREELRERRRKLVGRSSVFETRHRCKDGSIFEVEVCATGVRIDGEQLIFCVTREITERKQAEAALAARARQQAVVTELGKLALTGGEPQELFDRAVAMVAETLGVEYCKVLQLLPDESALKLVAGVGWREGLVGQATVGVGLDSQAGYALLTKDLVIVEDLRTEKRFNDPPLLREHGVVSGLSVIIGEIEKPFGVMGAHTARQRTFTIDDAHFFQSIANVLAEAIQRKRAENAMEESERKYRELVELSHDLVWAVDMEGRITYMSPASQHIYGRKPEEMIGHLFTDFMAPDEARRSMADLGRMIATGDSVIELETRLLHRAGHEIVLSANAVVLRDAAGNIVGTTGTSRDITGRKLAEEALRESEQRFRELAENIHEVFWMSDPENTRIFYASPAYETIWGRSRETLYSSPASWMDAIHPDDKERMVRTRTNRDSTFPHENTYRIVRPDGSIRWIRDRGFPVRDERDAVVRFAGIAEDITEQKRAEERLREYERVVEGLEEMIVVVDRDYRYLLANRAFLNFRGLEREQLIGRRVPDVLGPEAFVGVAGKLSECLAGKTIQYEMRYRFPDQSERDLLVSYLPIEGPGGIDRVACVLQDITERKQTEQARERGLSLMLATLESTADGILVVNTEGKMETFNRTFARMWRLSDEVLASKDDARALNCVLDQLIEPKKFLEKVRYLYRHPGEESFDRLVFKDGRVFERYSRPQLIGGKVAGRVWSFRDATERRRAAKALEEANDRLRFLSRRLFQVQEDERSHLARELHDEIGQTLTAAKINLQITAQDVPVKMAGRLDDSIQLLDRLLGQVRQLSLDLRPPLLDELGLVPALRWLVNQQAQRAALRVTFRTDVNGLPIDPTVQTTCFRVAQEAITNIIRHARAQKVAVVLRRRGGRLRLSVRDDGAGFDPGAIPEGTAHHLGLVSMKERVLLVGGGLEVRSTSGRGTEIRAWFPVAVGAQPSRTESS